MCFYTAVGPQGGRVEMRALHASLAHVFPENLPRVLSWSSRKSAENKKGVKSEQKPFDLGFASCICYTVVDF